MKDIKEIYVSLPSSWKELKFKDYQKFMDIIVKESNDPWAGIDNMNQVLSRLTGLSIDELEELHYTDAAALIHRVSFLTKLPEKDKSFNIKLRPLNEVTYNSYLEFLQSTQNKHLDIGKMVKAITYLNEEQIENLNMEEVWQSFFLLSHHLNKFRKHTMRRLMGKQLKNKLTPRIFRKKARQ